MRKLFLIVLFSIYASPSFAIEFEKLFDKASGCFLLYDMQKQEFTQEYNKAECSSPAAPGSNIQIPLSLMVFDQKIVKSENDFFDYINDKGEKQTANIIDWMKKSIFPISKILVKKMDKAKLKQYLEDFHYGDIANLDLTDNITIGKTIQINGYEQVQFLKQIYNEQIPVSKEAQFATKHLLVLEKNSIEFSGKPSKVEIKPNLYNGWFVGSVNKDNMRYIFATKVKDYQGNKDLCAGAYAKEVSKAILKELGLL
jgi:beta-lactamase class D